MIDFKRKLEGLREQKPLPAFWSDDFDTDLLKVFPEIHTILGSTIDVPIWTISHTTYGRLNCPTQWNCPFGCFIWLQKPNLPRDKNGWASIDSCVTQEEEVEGTWFEWLRDAWVHGQDWTLHPGGITFAGIDFNRCFYPIMANIRGWDMFPPESTTAAHRMAEIWLAKANRRFARILDTERGKK